VHSRTVWVLGDQISRDSALLREADPNDTRVLFVVSTAMMASRPWHRQRLHLVLASMRRMADDLEADGFAVDFRIATGMRAGVRLHCQQFGVDHVAVMEPADLRLRRSLADWPEVIVSPNDQFLCSSDEFAKWAAPHGKKLRMEDFYRWQRVRLGALMDGTEPTGGRWNYDEANREPPPKDGRLWPQPRQEQLDHVDEYVSSLIDQFAPQAVGSPWSGLWPTSPSQALARLRNVIDNVLPVFGPHEDAMLRSNWHLAHTVLSSSLNLGLLHPSVVVAAAEDAYRSGRVPIASAEGFIRQVIGWREYVYGVAHLWGEEYGQLNELQANVALPASFSSVGGCSSGMACLDATLDGIDQRAYAHHIQRLMVLGNLALLMGCSPQALTNWMRERFIDGADWVMAPNVVGMALHADGGRMATKPYAAGGAYISKMGDYCRGCRFDPRKRVGPTACPYTSLYWDFIARHEPRWRRNHRMAQPVAGAARLADLAEVRARAAVVSAALVAGTLDNGLSGSFIRHESAE
jgi:deoxyribodipyrimidine photolyase-related protein